MNESRYNGILNVLKPVGMTSFDVVAYLRGLLKTKKIGHTGTLDPGAAGVLPICLGNATKIIEFLTDKDKLYRAELTLGVSTDTQDSYGKVLEVREPVIDIKKINEAVQGFTGDYNQVPPMYSSIRVNGVRLYELAREGKNIERSPRKVKIYRTQVLKVEPSVFVHEDQNYSCTKILFDVECSKGTYIRTLCDDIGKRLGCGGHMSFLLRLGTGCFNIADSLTLKEIAGLSEQGLINNCLARPDKVFDNLKAVSLKEQDIKRITNGAPVYIKNMPEGCSTGEIVKIYSNTGYFLAVGEVTFDGDIWQIVSKKLFI